MTEIHIVGAGGIGVALAWSLARAGCAVRLVETNPRKLEHARAHGVLVEGFRPERVEVTSFEDWHPVPGTRVLLCTKTYDNPVVLDRIDQGVQLIPVQNGYDPVLESVDHAGEGIASFVSECERERAITRITRPGQLHIGPRRRASGAEYEALTELGAVLGAGGLFEVEVVRDVRPFKASKLMYNAAISPLAASAGVDNGVLLSDGLAKRLFFDLLRENYAILRQARVKLARIGPFHPDTVNRILATPGLASMMAVFFKPSLRGTYCSMAPDIGSGRTEIAAYNGHLVRLAGEFPCPVNRAVLAMMERITRERLPPRRSHLVALAGEVARGEAA